MNWTHKPMFFELPYWSKLKLRHNLDVMHVEKIVFNTLVGTILDIEGKTKDTIKTRLDLERMGIQRGLWMNRDSDKARRDLAFFSMKPNDKKEFLKFVSSVKFPDWYASNIARCVNVDGGKFTGLKSHDCHVFMQSLLPVGIRHLLQEDVVKLIMLFSKFFSQLTAKTLRKTDINQLRHDIVQVLCKFKMIFPPAFFTSMIHVMVHLPEEALLAGPVNYCWMYPIESYIILIVFVDEIYNLAFGPIRVELFSGCNVNDVKFLGSARDDKLCTQNSSVHVLGGGEKLDPTDNDVDNVGDQRLESSMENDAETLRDTNVIQEPFQIQGVSSIEIPIQSITIDRGGLPRYDVAVGPRNDDDVVIEEEEEEEEEEDWETESDGSDDNENFVSLSGKIHLKHFVCLSRKIHFKLSETTRAPPSSPDPISANPSLTLRCHLSPVPSNHVASPPSPPSRQKLLGFHRNFTSAKSDN
ncbi:unnamed protein product [Prunus brigantina]